MSKVKAPVRPVAAKKAAVVAPETAKTPTAAQSKCCEHCAATCCTGARPINFSDRMHCSLCESINCRGLLLCLKCDKHFTSDAKKTCPTCNTVASSPVAAAKAPMTPHQVVTGKIEAAPEVKPAKDSDDDQEESPHPLITMPCDKMDGAPKISRVMKIMGAVINCSRVLRFMEWNSDDEKIAEFARRNSGGLIDAIEMLSEEGEIILERMSMYPEKLAEEASGAIACNKARMAKFKAADDARAAKK